MEVLQSVPALLLKLLSPDPAGLLPGLWGQIVSPVATRRLRSSPAPAPGMGLCCTVVF